MNSLPLYLVSINVKDVETKILEAFCKSLVPQLKTQIDTIATDISTSYQCDTPFAEDVIKQMLVHELAKFIMLSGVYTDEIVHPTQLTTMHAEAWVK